MQDLFAFASLLQNCIEMFNEIVCYFQVIMCLLLQQALIKRGQTTHSCKHRRQPAQTAPNWAHTHTHTHTHSHTDRSTYPDKHGIDIVSMSGHLCHQYWPVKFSCKHIFCELILLTHSYHGRPFYLCMLSSCWHGHGFDSPCGRNSLLSHLFSKIYLLF